MANLQPECMEKPTWTTLLSYVAIAVFGVGLFYIGYWFFNSYMTSPSGESPEEYFTMGLLCMGSAVLLIAGGLARSFLWFQDRTKPIAH